MNKKFLIIAIILIATSIILGAFGAHGLKKIVDAAQVASFETGVKYQMYAGLSMLIIALNHDRFKGKINLFYNLLLIGSIMFSFSIYLLSIQVPLGMSLKFLGPVTPLGGLLMIVAWITLLLNSLKNN